MAWLKNNKILTVIILLSFTASLLYSLVYQIRPLIDADAYDKIAVNLINGFGFRENSYLDYKFDYAILRAGPGYEFFLAGLYLIFGHSYLAVWVAQALLHALTAWIVYLTARRIFPNYSASLGLIAAAFIGFHPDLIEISAMLMTETLYLFLVSLLVLIFVKSYQEIGKNRWPVILGAVTALTILCRPTVILFAPIIILAYLFKKNLEAILLFIIPLVLFLSPWIVRNYLVYHQFILTTLIGQYNLWVGNTLTSNGGQFSDGYNFATGYADTYGFYGFKAHSSAQFWNFIFSEPVAFIKLCFIRTVRFFSLIRPMGFWFYQTGLKQMVFVFTSGLAIAALFISGFSGIVSALKEKNPLLYFLILLALTSPFALILSVVQSRYRFQIYPLLAIFAGYFLVNLFARVPGFKKYLVITTVFLLSISMLDTLSNVSTVIERLSRVF